MLGRIGKDAGSLLGIEIAPASLRLLHLARGKPSAWAVEPLPAGAVDNGQIANPETVAAALRRALSRSGVRQRRAAVALSAALVISKSVQLPAGLSDVEIDERLRQEAEQFVPFNLDEAALDFQLMGPSAVGSASVDVAFCACHQGALDGLEAALDLAGLYPRVVDIDSHVLARALGRRLSGPAAMLQIEPGWLVLHTFAPGHIGQRSEARATCSVEQLDRWLLAEAQMPEQLWLCGAEAAEGGLAEQLQQRLGIATRLFDPFDGSLGAAAPSLAIAYGLALRGDD